jgi:two-component system sensor histidine kinase UhpB
MNAKIKILIAEHDPTDLEFLHNELRKGGINYVSEVVHDEPGYVKALKNFKPDIILSDYSFPLFDGLTAFKIREKIAPDTPFIFVSGAIGEEKSIELIRNGVTDYALKDKLFTLIIKIKRALKESKEKQEKKITEHELMQSEKRLARAQQIAHMGSWELDFSSNIVRWSDEACRIYGIPPDQNKQPFKTWLSFIHPEDVEFVTKKIMESRDSLPYFSINYRILHRNGSIRHIYTESKLEFDLNNKPAGLYGIVHDVTERVLLENILVKERRARQSEITSAVLKAHENERADIGREMHDNLNQILGAAKMYIEMAESDKLKAKILLDKACSLIVNVIDEIRRISKTLAAPGEQIGLFNSIEILIADLLKVHPLKIEFIGNHIDEKYLDENLQLTIFRIVQEQINNILKHAEATMATINLSMKDNEVILLISDNGKGNDFLKEIDGVGIKNIKSRADLYNGSVSIVSYPGKGYELKVTLHVTDQVDKPALLKILPSI